VNPQFTNGLSFTEKVFVMAHEVMHCLLQHMRRGKSHDPHKSNIAADYEVNISLTDDLGLFKYDTVKNLGALIDKKYLGWGYEKIYADHPSGSNTGDMDNSDQSKQAEKNQQQNQGQGQGQSGSGGKGDSQSMSDEYKKGWRQAMEDYKKGKLKF
jgi:predicted metal-dependent peptidase